MYKDSRKGKKKFPKHIPTFKSSTFTTAAPFLLRDSQTPVQAGLQDGRSVREHMLLEGAIQCTGFKPGLREPK